MCFRMQKTCNEVVLMSSCPSIRPYRLQNNNVRSFFKKNVYVTILKHCSLKNKWMHFKLRNLSNALRLKERIFLLYRINLIKVTCIWLARAFCRSYSFLDKNIMRLFGELYSKRAPCYTRTKFGISIYLSDMIQLHLVKMNRGM